MSGVRFTGALFTRGRFAARFGRTGLSGGSGHRRWVRHARLDPFRGATVPPRSHPSTIRSRLNVQHGLLCTANLDVCLFPQRSRQQLNRCQHHSPPRYPRSDAAGTGEEAGALHRALGGRRRGHVRRCQPAGPCRRGPGKAADSHYLRARQLRIRAAVRDERDEAHLERLSAESHLRLRIRHAHLEQRSRDRQPRRFHRRRPGRRRAPIGSTSSPTPGARP